MKRDYRPVTARSLRLDMRAMLRARREDRITQLLAQRCSKGASAGDPPLPDAMPEIAATMDAAQSALATLIATRDEAQGHNQVISAGIGPDLGAQTALGTVAFRSIRAETALPGRVATAFLHNNHLNLTTLTGVGPGVIWILRQCGIVDLSDLFVTDIDDLRRSLGFFAPLLPLDEWRSMLNQPKYTQRL